MLKIGKRKRLNVKIREQGGEEMKDRKGKGVEYVKNRRRRRRKGGKIGKGKRLKVKGEQKGGEGGKVRREKREVEGE